MVSINALHAGGCWGKEEGGGKAEGRGCNEGKGQEIRGRGGEEGVLTQECMEGLRTLSL